MKRFLFITLVLLCVFCAGAMAEESYLYPIRENGKWGYMDRQGTTVIEPQWDTVTGFAYEYAMVSSGNDFSVIRRDGTIAAGPYTVADRGKEVKINPRSFSIGKVSRKASPWSTRPWRRTVPERKSMDSSARIT